MTRSSRQYRWLKAQRKYRNLQKRIFATQDRDLISKLILKLEQLKRRLLNMNKKWQVGVAASVMMTWLSASPAQAQFPVNFDLTSLDGNNGFVLNGISSGDETGYSVSNIGDFNGDGIDDFIIGARGADPNFLSGAGRSYVVFGDSSGFPQSLNLSSLNGLNGFVLNGVSAGDSSGISVSNAGDVNNDNLADLIIGAFVADPGGLADAGQSYVVFGSTGAFSASVELSSLDGNNGFALNGIAANDRAGLSVSTAGDVNNDGVDDVIIGAFLASPGGRSQAGQCYVVYGKTTAFAASMELSSLDGNNGFIINGIDAVDRLGRSVNTAGDVNGDGIGDIIMGADFAGPNGGGSGEVYIVFGTSSFGAVFELSSLTGTNGFKVNGKAMSDNAGWRVEGAGDVNGDSVDDFLLTATNADPGGQNSAGEAYVVFGKTTASGAQLELSSLDGSNGFQINGIAASDRLGRSIDGGDINGDGFSDVVVGAINAGNPGAGEGYVIFGGTSFSASIDASSLNGSNGFTILGIDEDDVLGWSVSATGDFNADGATDILISSRLASPGGEVYVIFGQGPSCDVPTNLTTNALDNTTATLVWDDVNSGEEYEVEYKIINPPGQPWNTATVSTNTRDITGLTPGELYKFRVRGKCEIDAATVYSAYSNDFYFTTTIGGCEVPDGLGASGIGNETATLTWNDVNTQPTDEYEVMYRAISPVTGPWQTVSSLTDPTTNLTGLTPGTLYKYKVNGTCDLSGTSVTTAYSPDFYFTTTNTGCAVPDGLGASSVDNTSATLSWNDVNTQPTDEYEVMYRAISPVGGSWQTVSSLTDPTTNLTGLTPGTLYKYKVNGTCDLSGTSITTAYSGDFYFSTTITGCDVPDGLDATGITATGATLQWNDVNMGAMDEYEVMYRPISPLGPWETISSLTTSSTTVNTLSASTLYKFKVRGTCDLSGTSVTTSYSPDFYFSTPMMLTMDDATIRERLTEEAEELQINAYPNPSSGMVNLLFEPTEPGTGRLSIYALNGSRVFETEFTDRLDEGIDLAASGQGMYLVRIDFNDRVFESRVLIR